MNEQERDIIKKKTEQVRVIMKKKYVMKKSENLITLLQDKLKKDNQDIALFESLCMKQIHELDLKSKELELNKEKLYLLINQKKQNEEELKREKEFYEILINQSEDEKPK
jgi:hypothetical protein